MALTAMSQPAARELDAPAGCGPDELPCLSASLLHMRDGSREFAPAGEGDAVRVASDTGASLPLFPQGYL